MKNYPAYTATERQGRWVTTITLTARSRCGDVITATSRHRDPAIAATNAALHLGVEDTLSTIRCRRPGKHGHHA